MPRQREGHKSGPHLKITNLWSRLRPAFGPDGDTGQGHDSEQGHINAHLSDGQEQPEVISVLRQDPVTKETKVSTSGNAGPDVITDLHRHELSIPDRTTSEALWRQAYFAARAKGPEIVAAYKSMLDPGGNVFEPAIRMDAIVRQLSKGQRMDQLVIKMAGKPFRIREMGENIISFIWESKDFIASIAGTEPHAALAWTCMSPLLALLLNHKEQSETMFRGLGNIAVLIRLYKVREDLYINKRSDDFAVRNFNFENAIIKLYTHILEFQARLASHLEKSSLQQVARDTVKKDDWKSWLDEIEDSDAECRSYIELFDKEIEQRAWEKQYMQSDQQVRIQKCIFEALNIARREQEAHRDEDRHEKLLHSLSTDYEEQKDFNPLRVLGTCEWFLHSKEFLDWRHAKNSRILWVSAGPGCGKSVLSRCLIDERHLSTSILASTICYFFFKDGQEGRQTGANALKAITHQLLKQHPAPNIIQHALPRYTEYGDKFGDMFGQLWSNLLETLKDPATGEITCVLDALDECGELERKRLLDQLVEFYSSEECQKNPNLILKILVTSRQEPDIEARFRRLEGKAGFIELDGDEKSDQIRHEINLVISHRVPQVTRSLSKDDQMKVIQHLQSIGHRTYLWLHLMLDEIEHKVVSHGTEKQLAKVINSLPTSINEAYERILDRSKEPEMARKILLIIIAARRPLTVSELNVAFALAEQGQRASYEALDCPSNESFKSSVKQICGLFVSVYDQKVYLLHQTARDFLIGQPALASLGWKHSLSLDSAHSLLFHICVWLLCFAEFESPPWDMQEISYHYDEEFRKWIDNSILLRYAATNWMEHCQLIHPDSDTDLIDVGLELCNTSANRFKTWWAVFDEANRAFGDDFHVACRVGWYALVERMLNEGADVNKCAKSLDDKFPLHTACYRGQFPLIKLLLDRGASVNSMNSFRDRALHILSQKNAVQSAILLLDNGADIDAVGRRGTALSMASKYNNQEMIRLLLDRGANINVVAGGYGTALITACSWGNNEIVQLLLDRGANINVLGGNIGTALNAACSRGNNEIVQLLLDRGADIDVVSGNLGTALIAACRGGHEDIVQLLLDRGADIDVVSGHLGTALIAACRDCNKNIMQLLLDRGADIKVVAGVHGTALIAACLRSNKNIMQLLLDRGADFKVVAGEYGTALIAACLSGNKNIMQLLLDRGADFKVVAGEYGTALIAACLSGNKNIMQLLLDRGADFKVVAGVYGNALIAACLRGNKDTVQLLIENGADVNKKSPCFWADETTALHAAARYRHETVAQLLIGHGADVNLHAGKSGTPLIAAARRGCDSMAQFLIESGADVLATCDGYVNALIAAADRKERATVRLLLSHGARFCKSDWEGLQDWEGNYHSKRLDVIFEEVQNKNQEEMIDILLERKLLPRSPYVKFRY